MISKPLNLVLSLLLLMLSVSLVTFVLQVSQQIDGQLNKNIAPFDMVVGAKGSPLQLVLSSVLHIDAPTGNIKINETNFIRKHPFVKAAIPVSYGDNYKGFRILGTEKDYLDYYNAELSSGELFEKTFDIVVGSYVAENLKLNVGDTFIGSHGLIESTEDTHEEHPYKVTGILKPTGTVVDQLLITNLESIWDSHDHGGHDDHSEEEHHEHENGEDHDHHGDEHNHENDHDHANQEKEITSLLVKFKNPMGMVQLPRFINENSNVQAALPAFEIQRLMNLFGSGVKTVNGIALAILLVSGFSIFISLLKTIRERKKELALLRTYGLRTNQILILVFLEGLLLSLLGFILGWFLGRIGLWVASTYVQSSNGYYFQINGPDLFELLFLGIIFVITIIATLLASVSIFNLNVAKTLSDA